jgi:hypothetical protein
LHTERWWDNERKSYRAQKEIFRDHGGDQEKRVFPQWMQSAEGETLDAGNEKLR